MGKYLWDHHGEILAGSSWGNTCSNHFTNHSNHLQKAVSASWNGGLNKYYVTDSEAHNRLPLEPLFTLSSLCVIDN